MKEKLWILTGAFLFTISCNNKKVIKFDKKLWEAPSNQSRPSPYRAKMLKDLLKNYKLVGLSYNQVISMLGEPNWNDSVSLTYKVEVDFKGDIDPVYSKNLELYFTKDSIITAFNVLEYRN